VCREPGGRKSARGGVSRVRDVSGEAEKRAQQERGKSRWSRGEEEKAGTSGERVGSLFWEEGWMEGGGSWRGAFGWVRDGVTGMPEGDPLHRAVTTGTGGAVRKLGVRFGCGLEAGFDLCRRLPGLAFGLGQEGGLFEEGSDAVEIFSAGGMKPTKEPDAMEARGSRVGGIGGSGG
jgi:hypothetical protein